MSANGSPRGCSVVVDRDVPVPLRDGTVLAADVWRPAAPGRFPVLLQRLPYDKSSSLIATALAGLEPLRAVERGYVVVMQDTRGRYASGGRFDPFATEADDGEDTIAWAASLPYSSGSVGMYGASYVGATQLLAATRRPPALRALAPHVTSSEYYDGWTYQGGAFQLGFALFWTISGLAIADLPRREDADALSATLTELVDDPWHAYERLPLTAVADSSPLLGYYREWLEHPDRDEYWRATAVNDRYGSVEVPALHIGGWYDLFLPGTLQNYTGLHGGAATEHARRNQRLIVGPWAHGSPYDTLGEVEFGAAASQLTLDLTGLHLDWFDRFLKDDVTAVDADEAPVRLFVMGLNRWRDELDWPPPDARLERLYLRSGGGANGLEGDGRLEREPGIADESADTFVYDPRKPVPTAGGPTYLPGVFSGLHAGPRDQRAVEARRDVLVYTGPVLERPLEVTGPVSVSLFAASSARDTDFTAKLVDVHPDGRALNVTEGILRARFRNGLDQPELLEPGRVYRLEIDLVGTSMVFAAGHRLRLEIASSNFPRFDRNPNTGGIVAHASERDLSTARQRVFHDAGRPSCLILSVVER